MAIAFLGRLSDRYFVTGWRPKNLDYHNESSQYYAEKFISNVPLCRLVPLILKLSPGSKMKQLMVTSELSLSDNAGSFASVDSFIYYACDRMSVEVEKEEG